jgi:glyoxylase-like metal-dependent hydrolase (beta-lactamase superfamily II)
MAASVLTLDDTVRVLPGHGPETSIGHERKTNPFIQGL